MTEGLEVAHAVQNAVIPIPLLPVPFRVWHGILCGLEPFSMPALEQHRGAVSFLQWPWHVRDESLSWLSLGQLLLVLLHNMRACVCVRVGVRSHQLPF